MLTIKEMLQKDISRNINGVVKAENGQEETAVTELSEYVVTEEVRKYMTRFLDRYVESMNSPTEEMGIWISGFFGSGKSHLLKMLGHIIENKDHGGKKVSEYFNEKINDGILQGNLEKASEKETDVILFNIDNVSDQDTYQNKDSIVVAFLKKFNEHLGFSRDDIKTASFERMLWKDNRFEEFKELFLEETGEEWKESRRNIDFIADEFLDVIEDMEIKGFSKDAAERWLEKDNTESINAESFCDLLGDYLKIKGKNHRVVFLVDEIGQYIGDNSQLMLNLQTLVEQLGTKFIGRVWAGVTSQQDIGAILEDNDAKRNDFSKIQGRFKTMIPLSSGNIDEVIKKRLLEKRAVEKEDLEIFYEKKRIDIENLINFDKKGITLKLYEDKYDFAETYPFVGYQFNLLQTVFEKVRNMGHSGKHMSRGERSLLSSFQEAGIKIKDREIGSLVPFNYFYESIEQFLEDNARRPIIHAKNEKGCEDFDIEVLKLLFLLKGVDGLEPNLNNITSFMIDNIDNDRIELERKIKKSLKKLEKEVLIQKDGDTYYFLTNEEQDINREIKQEDVDMGAIYRELDSYIFSDIYDKSTVLVEETGNKYNFTRKIDEFSFGKGGGQLDIVIFTPGADDYNNVALIGNREGYDLILRLPEDDLGYLDEIKQCLKINSYIKKKQRENVREVVTRILESKQRENQGRKRRILSEINKAFEGAEIFIGGHKIEVKGKEASKVIEGSLKTSANNRFKNAKLIKKKYDESKIRDVLSYEFDGGSQLFEINNDIEKNQNKEAIKEVINRLKMQDKRGFTITLKDLVDYFSNKPYGWDVYSVNGIIAELWIYKIINIEESKEILVDSKEVKNYLTKTQSRNLERLVITLKEEIDVNLINKVNNLLKKLWGTENEISGTSPKDELFTIIEHKHRLVKGYEKECKTKGYPGKKTLGKWVDLLDEILSTKGKVEKILKEFLEIGEELLDLHVKESKVEDFFKTNKKEKFDKGILKISNIEKYKDYIGKVKETNSYNRLIEISESETPYNEIREIDDLIYDIESHEKEIITREINLLKEKANCELKRFKKIASDRDIILEKAKDQINKFINEVENTKGNDVFYKNRRLANIADGIEKSYRQAIRDEISSHEKEAIDSLRDKDETEELAMKIRNSYDKLKKDIDKVEDLEGLLKIAILDKDGFISEANGKSKKKERIAMRKISIKTKYNLETELDVNTYIDELQEEMRVLKEKMLDAVRENKVVDIK